MTERPTPTMSPHARERCAEMGISTKVAKRIARRYDVRYCTTQRKYPDRYLLTSREHPDYVVVTHEPEGEHGSVEVVTVLFKTDVPYVRAGTTWEACA